MLSEILEYGLQFTFQSNHWIVWKLTNLLGENCPLVIFWVLGPFLPNFRFLGLGPFSKIGTYFFFLECLPLQANSRTSFQTKKWFIFFHLHFHQYCHLLWLESKYDTNFLLKQRLFFVDPFLQHKLATLLLINGLKTRHCLRKDKL